MDSCIGLGLNLGLGGFRAETSQPLAPPGSWEFGALTCVPDEQTGAQGLHWVLWALQRIAADPAAEQHHGSSWSFGGLSPDMSLGLNLNSRQGCILFRRLRGSICFLALSSFSRPQTCVGSQPPSFSSKVSSDVPCSCGPDQGWNLGPLPWECGVLPLGHQEAPAVPSFRPFFCSHVSL